MITRKAIADAVFSAIDTMPTDVAGSRIGGSRLSLSAYLITGGGETFTVTITKVTNLSRAQRLRALRKATNS